MKKEFVEQCIEAVLDKICPPKAELGKIAVSPKFKCTLEEQVASTKKGVKGDFDHNLRFTVNYSNHNPTTIKDTLTLTKEDKDDGLIGMRYLLTIKQRLSDYPAIDNTYNVEDSSHGFSKDSYKGVLTFTHKPKQ